MIIKQHNFKMPTGTLFGIAGGVFGLVTIGFMIQSQLAPDTYASCTERYAQAGMFALKSSSGVLLGSAELQSRLAGREWGVLHNVAVKPDTSPQSKVAMTVNFKPGGEMDLSRRRAPSGVGFKWQPGFLRQASAACLSYAVRLPEKFKFAQGGTLPGLFGRSTTSSIDAKEAFSTRMRWLPEGKAGVQMITSKMRSGFVMSLDANWLKLPRGQWIQIEQEIVLNTPGKHNGALRIWIDGRLHLNVGTLSFRQDRATRFSGVIADTHYANRKMEWVAAPAATEVKLSPMVMRWN